MMRQQAPGTSDTRHAADVRRPPRWRRLLAAALVVSSTLFVLDVAPAAAGTCGVAESEAESRFLSKLNALRQARGLRTLVANPAIGDGSDAWSATMSAQNRLFHDPNYAAKIAAVLPDWSRAAENVGVTSIASCASVTTAVDSLHQAFVNSSGHYKNMVADHNQVGIGVHTTGSKLWVTVRFAMGSLPKPAWTSDQLGQAGRYVDGVYQMFVQRGATTSERNHWADPVLSGKRMHLTSALAASDEWAGARVEDLYQRVLGRSSDPNGRAMWVRKIAGGYRLEDVAAGFYGSNEYYVKAGDTDRAYVQSLYRDILGRGADPTGLESWIRKLNRGMGRTTVATGFYGSYESAADRVTDLYRIILGRGVDPTGLSTWTKKVIRSGDIVLAATLATSDEYWNRATR